MSNLPSISVDKLYQRARAEISRLLDETYRLGILAEALVEERDALLREVASLQPLEVTIEETSNEGKNL